MESALEFKFQCSNMVMLRHTVHNQGEVKVKPKNKVHSSTCNEETVVTGNYQKWNSSVSVHYTNYSSMYSSFIYMIFIKQHKVTMD